jgi:hypothetical protein
VLDLVRHRQTLVWLGLVAATLVSWWLSAAHALDSSTARQVATCAVLVVAFAKVGLVGWHFMELGGAPRVLRGFFAAWVLVVLAVLVGLYLARGCPRSGGGEGDAPAVFVVQDRGRCTPGASSNVGAGPPARTGQPPGAESEPQARNPPGTRAPWASVPPSPRQPVPRPTPAERRAAQHELGVLVRRELAPQRRPEPDLDDLHGDGHVPRQRAQDLAREGRSVRGRGRREAAGEVAAHARADPHPRRRDQQQDPRVVMARPGHRVLHGVAVRHRAVDGQDHHARTLPRGTPRGKRRPG